MFLVAQFGIRATRRDIRLLQEAQARWGHAYECALMRTHALHPIACVVPKVGKDGATRYRVDKAQLTLLIKQACNSAPLPLHSSARMSLIVAIGEQVSSWLALHARWMNAGRPKGHRPGKPYPPRSIALQKRLYERALRQSAAVGTLEEEDQWRAAVTRAVRVRRMPLYFGAATCGAPNTSNKPYIHHCGLLRRPDGRLFAALTLWGQGDSNGIAPTRARNRKHAGSLRNVRGGLDWDPSRTKSIILCPLECERGTERLFLRHGTPKSAELLEKEPGDFRFHVAFEFEDRPAREMTGAVLAVRRGVDTLAAWVILDGDGRELLKGVVEGKTLAKLVTEMRRVRAIRQQKGQTTKGDRRVSRAAEHHLYSLCRQLRSLACEYGAETVFLKDNAAGRPQRLLAYKHWDRMHQISAQLCGEAGLPEPKERSIYASWKTCTACGWRPGEPVRVEDAQEGECPACRARMNEEQHVARLLAYQVLYDRAVPPKKGEQRPPLGTFIAKVKSNAA